MKCDVCGIDNISSTITCRSCGTLLVPSADAPAASGLPVGTTLQSGMFSVGRVLGQGGFGITYLGSDVRLCRSVAIKEFFPVAQGCARRGTTVVPNGSVSSSEFDEERKKFLEEAQRLAQFQHPGIVKVHTMFEENNTAYMVMEFLKGRTLANLVEDCGPLPEQDAVGYIAQVGEALAVVHQANLLHRDIKPENVLVTDDARSVLIDFGTAREFTSGRTRRMTTMLTPGYAPLEQYGQHARFGVFTDVYALGGTLYHLLTGELPIQATDRASGVELPAPRRINPKVSRVVSDAVVWAMEMRVDRRPQSVREFLDALRGAIRPKGGADRDWTPSNESASPNPFQTRIERILAELERPKAAPPPTACDGRIQQINALIAQIENVSPAPKTNCPSCGRPTLERIQGQRSPQCPICRSAQLRTTNKKVDPRKCPVCRSGRLAEHHIEAKAMFCPVCRARILQQERRKRFGLALDLWWTCPGCHAEFDVMLGGRAKLITVGDDPTGFGKEHQGETLPTAEWQRRTVLSDVVWGCNGCNAQLYDVGEGRLALVSFDADPLGIGESLLGKTYYMTMWTKIAHGLSLKAGNTHCPACNADFDYDPTRMTMNLLSCDAAKFPEAVQYRGSFQPLETWSLIAAGKTSRNPGPLCSSCGAEFDDDEVTLKLVASPGKLAPFVGQATSFENWHRKARGLPTMEEENTLRRELASLHRQEAEELQRHDAVVKQYREQLQVQLHELLKQSYVGGFIPLLLHTTEIVLKKGERVLWESGANKMKQRVADGIPYWEVDEPGVLVVTNQRMIFRSRTANLWTRNLSKIAGVEQQYAGRTPIAAVSLDGLQKPVGFHVGEIQHTLTLDSRSFTVSLSIAHLREIIRTATASA